jgi:ubiquinone/menaquinone biosynthesis C-methylase UbiE
MSNLARLYIGCGADKRPGWVCIDANPDLAPDVVALADKLPMFADGSAAAIEACHLFEHLPITEARAALREWWRVLAPGGMLMLELPNLQRCFEVIGQEKDASGYDLGMVGIFGWPPMIETEGAWQIHKWGWTPKTLAEELFAAGFTGVAQVPIQQTWRPAAKLNRDMRLHALK